MKLVNRISLIITPRLVMHQWLLDSQFENVPSFAELSQESSCYLLDEPTEEQPLDELLAQLIEKHYQSIWHSELSVWDEFGDHTPELIDSTQFNAWFEVKFSGLTFDLATQRLLVAAVDNI